MLPYSRLLLGKIPTKKVKVGFRVAMASQSLQYFAARGGRGKPNTIHKYIHRKN